MCGGCSCWMHMLSLILAAEVYHCWEIFNMKHMRHKAQRPPRSHGGFTGAGRVARALRVPARPAHRARRARPAPHTGAGAVLMGSTTAPQSLAQRIPSGMYNPKL